MSILSNGSNATPSTWEVGTRRATIKLEAEETVTCTFTNTKQYILTVNKAGAGGGSGSVTRNMAEGWSGTVTSAPDGIYCGADCTEYYLKDTVVTLTAHPGVKSYLASWSGGCSGTGLTTQVTMDADKTCIATFGYPVGGIVVPVNRLRLLAPWLGLAVLASLTALAVALVSRRRG